MSIKNILERNRLHIYADEATIEKINDVIELNVVDLNVDTIYALTSAGIQLDDNIVPLIDNDISIGNGSATPDNKALSHLYTYNVSNGNTNAPPNFPVGLRFYTTSVISPVTNARLNNYFFRENQSLALTGALVNNLTYDAQVIGNICTFSFTLAPAVTVVAPGIITSVALPVQYRPTSPSGSQSSILIELNGVITQVLMKVSTAGVITIYKDITGTVFLITDAVGSIAANGYVTVHWYTSNRPT